MVKRREKTKRDELQLSIEIYEKRYQAKDFSGQLLAEYTSTATKLRYVLCLYSYAFNLSCALSRPAFAPLYSNQYHHQHSSNLSVQHNQWNSSSQTYSNLHHHLQNNKRDFDGLSTSSSRKEKRQYKKRKHKAPREIKPGKTENKNFNFKKLTKLSS
jgi:enhancer of polycomb-like protein